jgi:hypothetical protein
MAPPTNIDGTDITGATIDGQTVDSITVDGQTVFSQFTNPVALSNLVAWYPFDPSAYSGMTDRADDATAGLSGAANSTALDGTLSGGKPNYLSSGGVTDINDGQNSGAFNFDGTDRIDVSSSSQLPGQPYTITGAYNADNLNDDKFVVSHRGKVENDIGFNPFNNGRSGEFGARVFDGSTVTTLQATTDATQFHTFAVTDSGSKVELFHDGAFITDKSVSTTVNATTSTIGERDDGSRGFSGTIDDVRFYNKVLSASEISAIDANISP